MSETETFKSGLETGLEYYNTDEFTWKQSNYELSLSNEWFEFILWMNSNDERRIKLQFVTFLFILVLLHVGDSSHTSGKSRKNKVKANMSTMSSAHSHAPRSLTVPVGHHTVSVIHCPPVLRMKELSAVLCSALAPDPELEQREAVLQPHRECVIWQRFTAGFVQQWGVNTCTHQTYCVIEWTIREKWCEQMEPICKMWYGSRVCAWIHWIKQKLHEVFSLQIELTFVSFTNMVATTCWMRLMFLGWAGSWQIWDPCTLMGCNQRESNPSSRERAFLLPDTDRGSWENTRWVKGGKPKGRN